MSNECNEKVDGINALLDRAFGPSQFQVQKLRQIGVVLSNKLTPITTITQPNQIKPCFCCLSQFIRLFC